MDLSEVSKVGKNANSVSVTQTFDYDSGSTVERLIFRNRLWVLAICTVVTLVLGFSARRIGLNASFESFMPTHQSFIKNFLDNSVNLEDQGDTLNIVVQPNSGNILTPQYMRTLKALNDKVFLLPGVDRSFMESLWTSNVRWTAVTSQGLSGGPVMPLDFSGSKQDLSQLQQNIENSGELGNLVAPDYGSSVIKVPLLAIDANTGKPLNFGDLTHQLDVLRDEFGTRGVTIHITGFAMVEGDLIQGMRKIFGFFVGSVVIASTIMFWYTRCWRSTLLVVTCSMLAVLWQLGLLPLVGYSLNPYSVLVPFLIFAIGMSHGAQKMNGIMQDIGRGQPKLVAARMTFRRLFMAGFTALVCDAVGFAVLLTIKIQAIQDLAIIASLGVALLIFTNLILLPVLLSYIGVSSRAAERSLRAEANVASAKHPVWATLDLFTKRKYAAIAILIASGIGLGGAFVARNLQIGDLNPGAPELRVDSLYNYDDNYFVTHYANSSDTFVVMVKTPFAECAEFNTLEGMDNLEEQLRALPGVVSTSSLADFERVMSVELNEGNYDWYDLLPNQAALNEAIGVAPRDMLDPSCDFLTITAYLKDHKAQTLTSVVKVVQQFAAVHNSAGVSFLMAAGSAGIEAATNLVVKQASRVMLIEVYALVMVLCLITFRSWRAVLVAILPLALTSILAEALMVWLGIGVKVATLPVTALGVGIGVDYSLYILSVTLTNLRAGMELSEAYYRALLFTGKVVMLTGITLAAAVATWAFSPIQFQADMGELLAFMFLWNMLGALILLPSLTYFLLPPRLFVKAS